MNREEKPILQRVLLTISAAALLGAAGLIYFSGLTLTSGIIFGIALSGIATPAVSEVGGVLEVLFGIFEALLEGLMGVLDAIAGIFNF